MLQKLQFSTDAKSLQPPEERDPFCHEYTVFFQCSFCTEPINTMVPVPWDQHLKEQ